MCELQHVRKGLDLKNRLIKELASELHTHTVSSAARSAGVRQQLATLIRIPRNLVRSLGCNYRFRIRGS